MLSVVFLYLFLTLSTRKYVTILQVKSGVMSRYFPCYWPKDHINLELGLAMKYSIGFSYESVLSFRRVFIPGNCNDNLKLLLRYWALPQPLKWFICVMLMPDNILYQTYALYSAHWTFRSFIALNPKWRGTNPL